MERRSRGSSREAEEMLVRLSRLPKQVQAEVRSAYAVRWP